MTRLLLIRHGETTWNAAGRIQGHKNSPLSELGIAQADTLRHRLRRVHPAAIYSSDLTRAVDTIRPTSDALQVPIVTREALREKSFGVWEGLTPIEVEERFPGQWPQYRSHADLNFPIPGGETWEEVYERVVGACRDIVASHGADETVIITGHGGSLRTIILHALAAPMHSLFHLSLDNASVSCLDFKDPDHGRVAYLNDTIHLEALAAV